MASEHSLAILVLVLGFSGFTLNLHILVTASEYDTRAGDGGTDVHDAYKSCVSIGWMDIWCNLGHYMDSGLHRVCQFISVCASVMHVISVHPAGVHTHTHTVADTHIFLPLLVFSFVQTH